MGIHLGAAGPAAVEEVMPMQLGALSKMRHLPPLMPDRPGWDGKLIPAYCAGDNTTMPSTWTTQHSWLLWGARVNTISPMAGTGKWRL